MKADKNEMNKTRYFLAQNFSLKIQKDPLEHIRKQIMSALAHVVASVRNKSFLGHGTYTPMQNGFALMVRLIGIE